MNILRALERKRREICFSRLMLKVIAMISMLIDHAAIMLIKNGKLYGYDQTLFQNAIGLPEAKSWLILYKICRMLGRIAFPIFAFLIVEGFRKTSNLFKYAVRLLILALISEIPFNLMVYNKVFCFEMQNVIFTYFIGLIMLLGIKLTSELPIFAHAIICVIASAVCYLLKTDYWLEGMLLMFVFYEFRHDLNIKCGIAILITLLMSIQNYYGAAILSVFFIYFYDGRKGYFDIKQFSYLFFPLHMFVLYLIVYFSYI